MSLLFHRAKADHPPHSGLEGECTGKSLHDLSRLSHTNLSSLTAVPLCLICLLQCSEVLLPLGEHLTEDYRSIWVCFARAMGPHFFLFLFFFMVPLLSRPLGFG